MMKWFGLYLAAGVLVALVNAFTRRGPLVTWSMWIGRAIVDVILWPVFVVTWIIGIGLGVHRMALHSPQKLTRKQWKALRRKASRGGIYLDARARSGNDVLDAAKRELEERARRHGRPR